MTVHGWFLAAAGLLLVMALGSGPTTTGPSPHGQKLVPVPVVVIGGQGAPGGSDPTVEVTVGSWGPIPVLLDTGSSGLHVFSGAVNAGSGVTVGTQKANITYSGGARFTGVVASAVVALGSQATKGPISFALVQKASCTASKPACPASGGISGYESSRGVDGILGIGMQDSGGGVTSPILGMPGDLGETWSLRLGPTSGQLTLGATVPTGPRATRIDMRTAGTAAGHELWADDRIPLCVAAGAERECVHGLFDSGTPGTADFRSRARQGAYGERHERCCPGHADHGGCEGGDRTLLELHGWDGQVAEPRSGHGRAGPVLQQWGPGVL